MLDTLANRHVGIVRVLFVGADNSPGGVASYISAIAEHLSSAEFEFHATVSKHEVNRYLTEKIQLHELSNYGFLTFLSRIIQLRGLIRKINPSVLHLHTARAGILGICAAKLLNIPIIYSGHSWRFEQKDGVSSRQVFRCLERYISNKADCVTFLTPRDKEFGIKENLVKREKSISINTRIRVFSAANLHSPHRMGFLIPGKAPLIINIGQICERKNPILFLKIARKILEIRPDVKFEWLGDGELRDIAKAMAESMGISKSIYWLGICSSGEIEAKLSAADVLLFTSTFEGVPLAILEAKQAGLPIVSSNYPGVDSVIRHGTDGYIFNRSSPDDAVKNVIALLSDKKISSRFSEEGVKFFKQEHSGPEIMANEFGNIYKRLAP